MLQFYVHLAKGVVDPFMDTLSNKDILLQFI